MNNEVVFSHDKEFHEIVNNKETLKKTTEKFFYNLVDDLTLGIIFDIHRKYKTKVYDVDRSLSPEPDEQPSNSDIFGQASLKKTQECECPNCDRAVPATGFASHLEKCLGMLRSRLRNSSRRNANNNDGNNSNHSKDSGFPSDDEDDMYYSRDKRRKKKHKNRNKKGKGTPKKTNREAEAVETVNVDIEGDDDGDIREFIQDNSNHSSPADLVTSTSNIKKKDKVKNKKSNKRDRTSPSSTVTE